MKYYANMAAPMMLPRGSVDGSRNGRHFKNTFKKCQEICVFIVFIRHGQ